jgi:CHAT domain-containing protein/tetratricopeptide (TPR) repeat protein
MPMSLASPAILALGVSILTPGMQVQRTIAGAASQVFQFELASNQLAQLVVDQRETDLRVRVVGPDGAVMGAFDQRERGVELVSFVSRARGTHRLEVTPAASLVRPAQYQVRFAAVRPYRAGDDSLMEAARLATEARGLLQKGDAASVRDALERRRKALGLWQSLGESDAALATMVGIGDALFRLSLFDEAEREYRQALSVCRELHDRRTEAEILNNLAATMRVGGKVSEALTFLQQATPIWEDLRIPYGLAATLTNRGVFLWEAGDFDEARRHYTRALGLFRSLRDRRMEAYVRNNIALVLETLGERQSALEYLGQAILLLRAASDWLGEGRALVRRARIQLALGQHPASLSSVRQGLRLIGRSPDRLAEADGLAQLGRVYEASGEGIRARAEYERALAAYRSVGSRRGEADALHDIGSSYLASGDRPKAIEFLARALEVRRTVGLRAPEAETLIRLAQAERLSDDLDQARAHAAAAIAIAEQLRAGVFERELRISYSSSVHRYYVEAVEGLVALHRRRPDAGFDTLAFETVERGRARVLGESMRESLARASGFRDPALVGREVELREHVSYWSWQVWQLADRPATDVSRAARARLERLLEEQDTVEADLRRSDPLYARVLQAETLPLSVIQREVLDDRTVLLEYTLGEERSYVWVVTAGGLRVVELPKRADIERHAQRFYKAVSLDPVTIVAPGRAEEVASERRREAATLSRLLIGPIAAELVGRRVLVVADGALNNIPFAALSVPGRSAPLVIGHDLIMLPSASTLALLRREFGTRPPAPKLLAVLADPVFDPADARVSRRGAARPPATAPPSRRLSRLPFSRDEAESILALAPPNQRLRALDFDANRTLATSAALGEYRFVHFATHAVRDDRHPELSAVILSLVDRQGAPQDGFLRLQDVTALRLNADLVLLSACETAIGKQAGGEGLLSLARGFFFAGSRRVIATLWRVDDEAAARLLQLFYRALLNGATPAVALRAAQQNMRQQKRWADPFYWSGFVLQGEW